MTVVREKKEGVTIEVQVQPRASKAALVGVQGDVLRIRIAAPPIDGEANDALIRFMAQKLDVPRSSVTVWKGHTARRKTLCVTGIDIDQARRALGIEEQG